LDIGLSEDILIRSIVSSSIIATFTLVAVAIWLLASFIVSFMHKRSGLSIVVLVLKNVKTPFALLLVSLGFLFSYLVINDSDVEILKTLSDTDDLAINIWIVIAISILTVMIAHLSDQLLGWYIVNISRKTNTRVDDNFLPPIRRILPTLIYIIGILIAIDSLGVSISPILAGFGIGGLAVALAVQPTLSNFFAGTYVVTEGELKEGDFIELDGGPAGYVENVGWRSTKIRSIYNNLVIIPNSKMADSIVTNYFSPTAAMNVLITCGVSYESDLELVEKYALEESTALINDSDQAAKNQEPFFWFDNFGDSNIDFNIFMQASDRLSSFKLKNQLIKNIHKRFNNEGIEINYPVRKLIMDGENKITDFS
tara:strand:+ start:12726 stop:13829 length:1104 start_codon:yes stop_codon:yes gene_type:complete